MRRVLWWAAGLAAGFFILRGLGEDTALLLFGLAPVKWAGTVEALLIASGVALAVSVAVGVRLRVAAGHDLSDPVRYVIAAIAAFFCSGLSIGGLPDWNPLWMVLIFGACMVAGISILRSTTRT